MHDISTCRAHNQYEAEQWFGPLMVRELGPGPSSHWHGVRASAQRLTYRFQGRDFGLTAVHGEVAKKLMA